MTQQPQKQMSAPRFGGGRYVLLGVLATVAAMAFVATLPEPRQTALVAEGGLFEGLSVAGYLLCLALFLLLWGPLATLARWYLPLILALFAARELDLDKRPFTEGLLKARQYTGDSVETPELVLSALLLLAILASLATLLRRETGRFLRGLRRLDPAALSVLVGLLFLVGYKALDGLGRRLEPFGIELGESLDQMLLLVEEIGEAGIPLMFAIAICLARPATLSDALSRSPGTGV